MARPVDETKLERIRQTSMELIVHKGYGGASIAEIAKKAKVAEGYLYRHYKGKADLVEDILNSNIDELVVVLEELNSNTISIGHIFEGLIRKMFDIARKTPIRIQFIFVLMNDYNFSIREGMRTRIYQLCSEVKERGVKDGVLRADIEEDEIFLMGISYPVQYINYRLKGFFNKKELRETEMQKILKVCVNSLMYENK